MSGKRAAGWVPAESFPVGEFVEEELVAREWTRADLAERTGLSLSDLSQIIDGHQRLLVHLAERLGRAFGTSAVLWLNLDRTYRRWKAAQAEGGG